MQNPWDNDPIVGQEQAPQAPAPHSYTVGSPRPKKPEVREVGGSLGLVDPETGVFTPTYTPPPKADKPGGAGVEQSKAAGFYGRAVKANKLFEDLGVGSPSVVREVAQSILPSTIVNQFTAPDRQQAEAAQNEFIASTLRYESGAAIPPEELEAQRRRYYPVAGDSEETIALKRKLRATAIEALQTSAGEAVGQVADQTGGGSVQFKDQQPDLLAPRLTPQQEAAYNAFMEANPNATAEQLRAFGSSMNVNFDNADAIVDARSKGAGFVGADKAIYNEEGYKKQLDAQLNQMGYEPSLTKPAERGLTLGLADELTGLGGSIAAIANNTPALDAYIQQRDLHRRATEQSYEAMPVLSTAAELGGGVLLPGGSARSLSGLARTGAVQGGIAGFGYGDGAAGSIGGAAIGAPLGAAAGAAVGAGTSRLSGLLQRPGATAQEVQAARPLIEAGERQGIPIRQPDARPSIRGDFAAVEASESGYPIVNRALQADEAAIQQRVTDVGGPGAALDDFSLGQRVQSGGKNYLARTRSQANALYTRAEQMAGNAQGTPNNALQAIDQHIADLKASGENTNAGAIKYLSDLRADLQGGASIGKLRNIRSNVRGQINERNLTATDTERRVGEVLTAMSQDVSSILPANARAAFDNADKFYRQRMEFKDQVIRRFIGNASDPISPETAASRFSSFMKSKDYGRFSRMMDELDPADRADIAATVAERLGTGRNGEFSVAALATNTDPSKFNPKALEKVFGKDGAEAIADLRMIASAKRETSGALNSSKTGIVNQRMGLKDALMGVMGGSVAGIPGAVGGMAFRNVSEKIGNRRMANALLSPDFTKWLKNAPTNPAAARPYISRLSAVAARNAGSAADIKAIQSVLIEAFAQSPGRAAAQGQEVEDGR